MVLLPIAFALTLQASPPQQAPPAPAPAARPAPKLYNDAADANAAIDAAIKSAALDEVRVLVNWGANDNERSAKIAEMRRQRDMASFFSDEYKVVMVDVGRGDRNADVVKKYGAVIDPAALPAFTILDHTGKVLAQGSSRALQSDSDPAAFDPAKMSAFLAKYKAPAPDAAAAYDGAVARAKREGKTVFVWFAAPW